MYATEQEFNACSESILNDEVKLLKVSKRLFFNLGCSIFYIASIGINSRRILSQ